MAECGRRRATPAAVPDGAPHLPAPLDGARVRFYALGRNAVWQGMRLLRLAPGAVVLFPAYHCGAELSPILQLGIRVRFYRVDLHMRVDFESLNAAMSAEVRALYLIHYLGCGRELEAALAFCRRHNLHLIEDCAQALYSGWGGWPLGTFGSLSIFSMRKSLLLPDGGALVVMARDLPMPPDAIPGPREFRLRGLRCDVEQRLDRGVGRFGPAMKRWLLEPGAALARRVAGRGVGPSGGLDPDPLAFEAASADWAMSPGSLRLLQRADHDRAAAARRANYRWLAAAAAGIPGLTPVLPELPEEVCPWMFPLLCQDADDILARFRRDGLYAARLWVESHPAFPAATFPEAARLKREVVVLPIDQGVSAAHLAAMTTLLRRQTS